MASTTSYETGHSATNNTISDLAPRMMFYNHDHREHPSRGVRFRGLLGACIAFLCIVAATGAQTPITVTVTLTPPYSPDLSVWRANPGRVLVTLVNSDRVRSYNVRLSGTGENLDGSVRLVTKNDFPVAPIVVPAGGTKMVTGSDLRLFDPNLVTITGADRNTIARTGMLPEGSYRLCARALDHGTLAPLSASEPSGCAGFTIRLAEEPKLLVPACNTTVQKKVPQLLTFQWSTPPGAPVGVRYDLEIVEIVPATRAPEEAFRSATLFAAKKGIVGTSIQYSAADPTLVAGKTYAWRVRAFDPIGRTPFRHNGYSQPCAFEYATMNIVSLPDSVKLLDPPKNAFPKGKQSGQNLIEPPLEEGECPGGCLAAAPQNTVIAPGMPAVGDSLTVGKFTMTLTQVQAVSGGKIKGEGVIRVPYLRGGVKVSFDAISVNSSRIVFDGDVYGRQSPLSPLSPTPQQASSLTGAGLAYAANYINGLVSTAQQNLVSGITGYKEVDLPIGLDQTIAGQNYTIAIYGIVFTPTAAKLNALMSLPLPGILSPQQRLTLGAIDICFHPDGISGAGGKGVAELKLLSDIGYNKPGSYSFLVKGSDQQGKGTAVRFDCLGFRELDLEADVIFPRDWFIPVPDNNQQAKATLHAKILHTGNWMGSIDPISWEIAPLRGFRLNISEMTYDGSDTANPAGILFPPGYQGTQDTTWNGFHIGSAEITMPDAFKTFDQSSPKLTLTNMLIDGQGLTVDINATSIIQYPKANLANWGGSLDSIGVRIVNSSFHSGQLKGKIQVPISQQGLDYIGTLSVPDNAGGGLLYSFSIIPKDTLEADLWLAKLHLLPTSYITLGNNNPQNVFRAEANFNGDFTLPPSVASVTKFALDFSGVQFQNLRVQSDAPYFQAGTWKLASPQKWISGFPVSAQNIHMVGGSDNGSPMIGLQFDITANLFDSLIAGKTTLTLRSTLGQAATGGQRWTFKDVRVNEIDLHTDVGAVKIDGKVAFYYDDNTFGDGFLGSIKATIAKLCEIQATAQFGSVNDFRYWFVDARAGFATGIPIPGVGALGFYGFGGGIWHHMKAPQNFPMVGPGDNTPAPNGSVPGQTNTGAQFLPDKTVEVGLKASATLGTYPDPKTFNGDIGLWAEIIRTNGSLGLGAIGLSGDGYMMTDVVNRGSDPPVRASADIVYDAAQGILSGLFDFQFDAAGIVQGNGMIDFRFGSDGDWHVYVGTPQNQISIKTLFLDSKGYMMAGTTLPTSKLADVIPPQYHSDFNSLGSAFNVNNEFGPVPGVGNVGGGFAMGASTGISTGGPRKILIFYLDLFARVGFDIALRNMQDVQCLGKNSIGMDGWYAQGQAYAFLKGDVGIEVDLLIFSGRLSIFNVLAGAMVKAAVPNPTFLEGHLAAKYSVLDGLIEGSFGFNFTLGEKCVFVQENPLAKIPLIQDMQPSKGAKDIPVYVEPQATFAFRAWKPFTLQQTQPDGSTKNRTFRLVPTHAQVLGPNGDTVQTTWRLSNDSLQIGITPYAVLNASNAHSFRLRVEGQELIGNSWVAAKTNSGKPIFLDTSTTFTTGKMPKSIPHDQVQYSYPRYRQRYLLQNEPDHRHKRKTPFYVQMRQAWPDLFAPKPDTITTFFARFVPINGGDIVTAPFTVEGSTILMQKPMLQGNTTYQVQIVRKDSAKTNPLKTGISYLQYKHLTATGDTGLARIRHAYVVGGKVIPNLVFNYGERLLYSFHFRTSQFNTLAAKLAGVKLREVEVDAEGNVVSLIPRYETEEKFDVYDVTDMQYKVSNVQTGSLGPLVEIDAVDRTSPWHKNIADPKIYGPATWLRQKGLWFGTPLRESTPGAVYYSAPRTTLSDHESTPSKGTIPLPTGGLVAEGYNSGSGYQSFGAYKPTFQILYRDGITAPNDFTWVHNRVANLLAQDNADRKYNADQRKKFLGKGKQELTDQYSPVDTLAPAIRKKLEEYNAQSYTRITVGTYKVAFSPYNNSGQAYWKDFSYMGVFKPMATKGVEIDPNDAVHVVWGGYQTKP